MTVSSTSQQAHDVFIVIVGTWNYSTVYLVFPNNSGSPVVRLIASYQGSTPIAGVTIEANGNWGLKLTGVANPSTKMTVVRMRKIYE